MAHGVGVVGAVVGPAEEVDAKYATLGGGRIVAHEAEPAVLVDHLDDPRAQLDAAVFVVQLVGTHFEPPVAVAGGLQHLKVLAPGKVELDLLECVVGLDAGVRLLCGISVPVKARLDGAHAVLARLVDALLDGDVDGVFGGEGATGVFEGNLRGVGLFDLGDLAHERVGDLRFFRRLFLLSEAVFQGAVECGFGDVVAVGDRLCVVALFAVRERVEGLFDPPQVGIVSPRSWHREGRLCAAGGSAG